MKFSIKQTLGPYSKTIAALEPVIGFAIHHIVKHGGTITKDGIVNIIIGLIGVFVVYISPNTTKDITTQGETNVNAHQ